MAHYYVDIESSGWEIVPMLSPEPDDTVTVFCDSHKELPSGLLRGVNVRREGCYRSAHQGAVAAQLGVVLGMDMAIGKAGHYIIVSRNRAFETLMQQYPNKVQLQHPNYYSENRLERASAILGVSPNELQRIYRRAQSGFGLHSLLTEHFGEYNADRAIRVFGITDYTAPLDELC